MLPQVASLLLQWFPAYSRDFQSMISHHRTLQWRDKQYRYVCINKRTEAEKEIKQNVTKTLLSLVTNYFYMQLVIVFKYLNDLWEKWQVTIY